MNDLVIPEEMLSCPSLLTLAPIPNVKVFEREGLQLNLSFARPSEIPALLLITATATNSSGSDVTHFVCQAAVPKVCIKPEFRGGLGSPGKEAIKWKRGWERVRWQGSGVQTQALGS